jgi:hypothetical protein
MRVRPAGAWLLGMVTKVNRLQEPGWVPEVFLAPHYCCGVTVPSQVGIADMLTRTTASA